MSFIKWCGGKSKQAKKIVDKFDKNYDIYVECFIGGGSVFFELKPENAIISDINKNLINCYLIIKHNLNDLKKKLKNYHENYNKLPPRKSEERKKYYYDIRDKYNKLKYGIRDDKELDTDNKVLLASYFIFLNKTGFNGMYRENRKGKFNIPIGDYEIATIYNESVLDKCNNILKNTDIRCGEALEILNYAKDLKLSGKKILCYLDPPYYVCNESKFKDYTADSFSNANQKDLANFLYDNKIEFYQSNSYCEDILKLYNYAKIDNFEINRSVKGSKNRGKNKEVFIVHKINKKDLKQVKDDMIFILGKLIHIESIESIDEEISTLIDKLRIKIEKIEIK